MKHIWWIVPLIFIIRSVSSQICSLRSDNWVSCQNVKSMAELSDKIKTNWTRLEINNLAYNGAEINFQSMSYNFAYIKELDLARAGVLKAVDNSFSTLTSLLNLNISDTRITEIRHQWFSTAAKNIEILNASKNRIKNLKRESIKPFTKLKQLNISYNAIELIEPNAFFELKKLEVLSLNNNALTVANLGIIENLKTLNLRDNVIVRIFANSFNRMLLLEKLSLAKNSLVDIIDRSFWLNVNLKSLNISSNSLKIIRPFIFAIQSSTLIDLDLGDNDINLINPMAFDTLLQLQTLDLSENFIKEITDKNFIQQSNLKKLALYNNDIVKVMPKAFEKLIALESLDISGNKIDELSMTVFGLNRCDKLKKLLLGSNRLTTIHPYVLRTMINLEELDLSQNELSSLDVTVFKETRKLKKLRLNNNNLDFLTDGIFDNLLLIQEIYLNNLRLTFLPSFGQDISKLKTLTFENNPLQCICLKDTIILARKKKIYINQSVFDGKKISCVVTPLKSCIRDLKKVKEHLVAEQFYEALDAMQQENMNQDF